MARLEEPMALQTLAEALGDVRDFRAVNFVSVVGK